MTQRVTYGQLRTVLSELGFQEIRRQDRVALKHEPSDTVFLFWPYDATDGITAAEFFVVKQMLDERGLLEPESFETLLTRSRA